MLLQPELAQSQTRPGLTYTLCLVGDVCLGQGLYCVLLLGLTTLVALLSWHLYEKHWLGLKERLTG